MSEFNVTVPGGESLRLLTGGKYCPADILVTAEGGGVTPVVEKDINFWDYDGELLYSYTLDEMQALTELPPNAEHEGLIGEGWNWSLEGLKENNGPRDVAALYITEDNATWFDLENDLGKNVEVTFMWKQTSANGATIDFGDGSTPYSTSATGNVTVSHTYAPGVYRAKISGKHEITGSSTSCCVKDMASGGSYLLRRAFIGRMSYLREYAFKNCVRLETYTIPSNLRIYGTEIFYRCCVLKFCYSGRIPSDNALNSGVFENTVRSAVVSFGETLKGSYSIPSNVRRVWAGKSFAFNYCSMANNYAISQVNISDATTILASRAFQNCYSLTELTIPASVATIKSYAFSATNLRCLRFKATTPPNVENANAFGSFPTDCIVEVPAGSLAAYQAATNYGTIAAQMVGV